MTDSWIVIIISNHLDLAPVVCQALVLIVFFWHFANGEMEAENGQVTTSRSYRQKEAELESESRSV